MKHAVWLFARGHLKRTQTLVAANNGLARQRFTAGITKWPVALPSRHHPSAAVLQSEVVLTQPVEQGAWIGHRYAIERTARALPSDVAATDLTAAALQTDREKRPEVASVCRITEGPTRNPWVAKNRSYSLESLLTALARAQ
jgi:hypothetical protein